MSSTKSTKSSLDSIMAEIKSIKNTQKRYEEQFLSKSNDAAAACNFVADATDQRQHLEKMEASIQNLEKMVKELATTVRDNEKKVDDIEQYSRRNCLILHGNKDIPSTGSYSEFELYVLNKLNSRLNLDYKISSSDIDTCHVLPTKRSKPVPIIIKFVRRSVRELVFINKKKLKVDDNSEKLSITESLTKRRLNLLMEAKKAFGYSNVWSYNGSIYCYFSGKRQVINDITSINDILKL